MQQRALLAQTRMEPCTKYKSLLFGHAVSFGPGHDQFTIWAQDYTDSLRKGGRNAKQAIIIGDISNEDIDHIVPGTYSTSEGESPFTFVHFLQVLILCAFWLDFGLMNDSETTTTATPYIRKHELVIGDIDDEALIGNVLAIITHGSEKGFTLLRSLCLIDHMITRMSRTRSSIHFILSQNLQLTSINKDGNHIDIVSKEPLH